MEQACKAARRHPVKGAWGSWSHYGGGGIMGGTRGDPEGGNWVGPRPEGLRRGCTLLLWAPPH